MNEDEQRDTVLLPEMVHVSFVKQPTIGKDHVDREIQLAQVAQSLIEIGSLLGTVRTTGLQALIDAQQTTGFLADHIETLCYALDVDDPENIEQIASWLDLKATSIRREFGKAATT